MSFEDRRANVSRGQRLLAFSVYTAYYHMLTGISRNFLEEKTNSNSPSRHLLRKVDRRVLVLFRKVNINWSAVDISTCLRLSEWQICIFWLLRIAYLRLKIKWVNESKVRFSLFCSYSKENLSFLGDFILTSGARDRSVTLNLLIGSWRKYRNMTGNWVDWLWDRRYQWVEEKE